MMWLYQRIPGTMKQLKMLLGITIFLLLLGQPLWGAAQNDQEETLSLEQAREYALQHNINMRNVRADLEIARKSIWEITASGLPQISGSVGYQYFVDIPTSLVPAEFFGGEPGEFREIKFGTPHNLTASATVSQMIFDGSYIIGLRAAKIYRDIADKNVLRTELEVKNTVTETYLLVLLTRENLEILRKNLENMQQTLFETRQILEAGLTDPINVDQLQLAVANMKTNINNLERQYQLTSDMLKFQIGMEMDQSLRLTDTLEALFGQVNLELAADVPFDPESHITYLAMLSQQNFSHMVMRREQSTYLPTITATFTRQENAMREEFNFLQGENPWFPTTIFAVNMEIPIFSSGLRSSRVKQARIEWEKAQWATWQMSQSLIMQIKEARASFKTALETYEDEKENLALAERILERTQIMQREGMSTSLELTQANEQFLTTQSNYLNAMFELLNAQNNMKQALGKYELP